MTIDEVKSRKKELEKRRDDLKELEGKLKVETATLQAQLSLKQQNIIENEETRTTIEDELTKINNVFEILNIIVDEVEPPKKKDEEKNPLEKFEEYKPNNLYHKGDRFRVEKRAYEVNFEHKSDNHFNSLLTNKYQLIDPETLKPIFDYSIAKTYNKGDKVLYDNIIYTSLKDDNKLSPRDNPDWKKE
nr:MAG TPA: Chitin oligosaccharide deacetylase [Caudoviricetes sp.]